MLTNLLLHLSQNLKVITLNVDGYVALWNTFLIEYSKTQQISDNQEANRFVAYLLKTLNTQVSVHVKILIVLLILEYVYMQEENLK